LDEDHLLTPNQTVYFTFLDGGAPQPQITVTGPRTFTFTFSGTGQQGSLLVDSNRRFIGDLTTSLRYGPTLADDGITDLYNLANRYKIRRAKEISDLVRGRVGDAKMQTRWRILWEDQMIVNWDDPFQDPPLAYLKRKWTARAVNEYLYGWHGAPYFFAGVYNASTDSYDPPQNQIGATVADVVAGLAANCVVAKIRYHFELRKAMALNEYSIESETYEGGPDTKMYIANPPAADAQVRCAAQFDPGIQAPIQTMLTDWFRSGAGIFTWYTVGFLQPTTQSVDAVWGVTDDITHLTTPKLAAMAAIKANPPAMTRNAIPGVLDGRTLWCDSSTSTTYGNLSSFIGHLRALIFAPVTGTYTIRVRYTCNQSSRAANVRVNRNLVSGSPFSFTNQGTGIAHDTLRGTNGAGTLLLPDMTVTLNRGANAIDFARTGSQGDDVEIYSIQVI
jgi:hypothetical protein